MQTEGSGGEHPGSPADSQAFPSFLKCIAPWKGCARRSFVLLQPPPSRRENKCACARLRSASHGGGCGPGAEAGRRPASSSQAAPRWQGLLRTGRRPWGPALSSRQTRVGGAARGVAQELWAHARRHRQSRESSAGSTRTRAWLPPHTPQAGRNSTDILHGVSRKAHSRQRTGAQDRRRRGWRGRGGWGGSVRKLRPEDEGPDSARPQAGHLSPRGRSLSAE